MAAGYLRKLVADAGIADVEVRNAGIMTVPGLKATPEAIQVLDTVDVDLRRHNSRKLSNETIKRADLILGMSSFHVQTALRQSPAAKGKTFLLKEYVGFTEKNVQISDPMGGTLEVYKKCFQEIKSCVDRLIEHDFVIGGPNEKELEAERVREKRQTRTARGASAKKPAETRKPAQTTTSRKAGKAPAKKAAKPPAKKKAAAKSKPKPKPTKKSATKKAASTQAKTKTAKSSTARKTSPKKKSTSSTAKKKAPSPKKTK
jgi:protein-tyrosine-phosphatase